MERHIDINQFDYDLPDRRIAKFPLAERSASKLLVYRNGAISESRFDRLGEELPEGAMLVFNNTKVIRARIIMHKPSGARIEVFCLEPHAPADYERAFAVKGKCAWSSIVGNLKKWKEGALVIDFTLDGTPQQLRAYRTGTGGREQIVRFEWEADLTFGELLELLGRIPIPPYLNRDSQQIDYTRYQTVYSKFEGSVAAPTAGLHFTPELIASLGAAGVEFEEVTLHVGAGTFLPRQGRRRLPPRDAHRTFRDPSNDRRTAVAPLGPHRRRGHHLGTHARIAGGAGLAHPARRIADEMRAVGQWELYDVPASYTGREALEELLAYMERNDLGTLKASTQIMIAPLGYRWRIVRADRHQFPTAQIDPAAAGFGLRRRRLAQNL